MSVLIFLIPITLALGFVGLAAFIWSMKSGQFDDLKGIYIYVFSKESYSSKFDFLTYSSLIC